jgi:FkbM family methyltransferase
VTYAGDHDARGTNSVTQLPGHPIFDRYPPWAGEVDAGRSANFLGVVTRDEYIARMSGVVPTAAGWLEPAIPPVDEEYFEWIDVLEAVASAEVTFTMIELGAGYGRWLMNAAAAARMRGGLSLQLIGVEAEPTHFQWMGQHFDDNGVPATMLSLIQAAVAGQPGRVRFHIGDPDAWYGQAIDPNQPTPSEVPRPRFTRRLRRLLAPRPRREARTIVEVPAVTLASILDRHDLVDLLDLDVQGAEADVLEPARAGLDAKVRRVHVGTHSLQNERRVRALFDGLAWTKLNDYACGSEAETPWGPVRFEDGVQTWLNPRLGRT